MWKEFKAFALKGNVLDLAIGVIVGAAFGKIVTSLVEDMLMPVIGLLMGGIDLKGLQFQYGDTILKYGAFLQTIIDFFIVSFSIFLFVKGINKLKRKEEPKPGAAGAVQRRAAADGNPGFAETATGRIDAAEKECLEPQPTCRARALFCHVTTADRSPAPAPPQTADWRQFPYTRHGPGLCRRKIHRAVASRAGTRLAKCAASG